MVELNRYVFDVGPFTVPVLTLTAAARAARAAKLSALTPPSAFAVRLWIADALSCVIGVFAAPLPPLLVPFPAMSISILRTLGNSPFAVAATSDTMTHTIVRRLVKVMSGNGTCTDMNRKDCRLHVRYRPAAPMSSYIISLYAIGFSFPHGTLMQLLARHAHTPGVRATCRIC